MPVFQERKYNLNIFCSYYREIDVVYDVFPAALFVHELDKHELFGVHIVGHIVVWDNNSCFF